jgi:hypothetical protein
LIGTFKCDIIIIAFSFLPLLFSSFSPPSAKSRGFFIYIRLSD